ncbi:hypothetical protein ILYODFUR_005113 [Ilyodon furcidens]|uniref:Uncharacterized protein n=1 Tax=Ilyodon furcidens TaxID=33524 RepID=A0ABV0UT35_9TELE
MYISGDSYPYPNKSENISIYILSSWCVCENSSISNYKKGLFLTAGRIKKRWSGDGAIFHVCMGEVRDACVCVGDKHKAEACREKRKLLCATESIGSLFAEHERQLAIRTDWDSNVLKLT